MDISRKLVLVTPNISEQMGGEAIKAFQFLRHLVANGRDVTVVAHRRSAEVIAQSFPHVSSILVEDTIAQKLCWLAPPLKPLVDVFFFRHARPILLGILKHHPDAIIHYLCPVSPILPRFPLVDANNIIGPLTGNIYYPPAFRSEEPVRYKFARLFHYVAQRAAYAVFGDKQRFDSILVSGGERTRRSLVWAGASEARIRDVTDSGISDGLSQRPVLYHAGRNPRFMTSSRLVPYKGVQLTIEALAHVADDVRFDVYGAGSYRHSLEKLARSVGVAHKVAFKGWTRHDDLIDHMADYRGFIAPSLAEANGISVQEAMMAGLPVICLRWGGPELLADQGSAILIEPADRNQVVRDIAVAIDRLSDDPDHANRLAESARSIAERRFSWDDVAREWQSAYVEVR